MADKQMSMFAAGSESTGPARTSSFTLSRTLRADAQKAIDQWLIPVFIGEWMFGEHAGDNEVLELNNTVRRGGEFNYRTVRGGKTVSHEGSFLELRIPNRLVCSWQQSDQPEAEAQISVDFEALGDKTRMKVNVMLPEALETERDSIKNQWTARCDALAARLKSG